MLIWAIRAAVWLTRSRSAVDGAGWAMRARIKLRLTGEVTGFVLRGAGLPTIYVSGDDASLDSVSDISQRIGAIDVALLFAGAARSSLFDGAPLTLTSADAAVAAQLLGARSTIPLQITGWAQLSEGPGDVETAFAAAGLTDRLRIIAPGCAHCHATCTSWCGSAASKASPPSSPRWAMPGRFAEPQGRLPHIRHRGAPHRVQRRAARFSTGAPLNSPRRAAARRTRTTRG